VVAFASLEQQESPFLHSFLAAGFGADLGVVCAITETLAVNKLKAKNTDNLFISIYLEFFK